MTAEYVLFEHIKTYIMKRLETDYKMPIILPYIPILLIITSTIIMILSLTYTISTYEYEYEVILQEIVMEEAVQEVLIALFIILYITGAVINIYVLYKWIKRRNDHIGRTYILYTYVKDFMYELGKKRGLDLSIDALMLDRELKEWHVDFRERNPILWALLPLIPYIGLVILFYIYHFLNKDFRKHWIREAAILNRIRDMVRKFPRGDELSMYLGFSPQYQFPDRSTALYVVLTIITLGFFSLYWIYTLTSDPNKHFDEHVKVEDHLVKTLEVLLHL